MIRALSIFGVLLLLAGLLAAQSAVAFQVDRIHVGDGTIHEPGMLLIRDGKIVAVGSSIEIPKGTPVIKRPGCEITAGLVDAAVIGLVAATEQVSEVIPEMQVADSIDLGNERFLRLAREGVTTVFATATTDSVIGCQGASLKTGATAKLIERAGDCKLTLSKDPSSRNGGPRRGSSPTVFTRRPTSQMGVVYVARDAFMRAADMRDRGLKYLPGSADEVLGRILAGQHGLRVRAEEQYEIAAAMRMAAEFGFRFVLEGGDESWRIAEELGKAGVPVVLGPIRAPESTGGGGRFRRSEPKRRAATAAILAEAKVPLALSAGDQDGEYGLARQGTHARRHGLGLKETLAAVTSRPADLLGLGKRIGRVAVGFDADILLWTGEPFAATSAIDMVMIDGVRVKGRSF